MHLKLFECRREDFQVSSQQQLHENLVEKLNTLQGTVSLYMCLRILAFERDAEENDLQILLMLYKRGHEKELKYLQDKVDEQIANIPSGKKTAEEAYVYCTKAYKSVRENAMDYMYSFEIKNIDNGGTKRDMFVEPYVHPGEHEQSPLAVRTEVIVMSTMHASDAPKFDDTLRSVCQHVSFILAVDVQRLIDKHLKQLKKTKKNLTMMMFSMSPIDCGQSEYSTARNKIDMQIKQVERWQEKYLSNDGCVQNLNDHKIVNDLSVIIEMRRIQAALFDMFKEPAVKPYLFDCYHQQIIVDTMALTEDQFMNMSATRSKEELSKHNVHNP